MLQDKNLLATRVVHSADTLSSANDFQVVLDSDEVAGEYDLTLPPGKNDLTFRIGISQASITAGAEWTLVPDGADTVDAAIGVLGAAPCGLVFKNGVWFKI